MIHTARADPYGLNNLVVIINDEWVCRFPRTEASRAGLRQEAAVLSVVGRHVGLPVPAFDFDETRPFVAYRLLAGRPMYRHDLLRLDDAAQDRFAADVAAFLRELHAIPIAALAEAGVPMAGAAGEFRDAPEWLAAVRAELYPHLWADQQAYIEDLFAPVLDGRLDLNDFTPALIHNDLATYHLLGDPATGQLGGVLDFGCAQWDDPARDYATLLNAYGESFVGRMARFGPLPARLVDRARFHAARLELEWALRGVKNSDPEWYLVHIGRARDSRPIGQPL